MSLVSNFLNISELMECEKASNNMWEIVIAFA
jgi:hypothetical protein